MKQMVGCYRSWSGKKKLGPVVLEKRVLPHDLPKGEKHQCHEHLFSLRWFTGALWTEIGPIDSEFSE